MKIFFNDPQNWFTEVKESERFLKIFIEQVEEQISTSIADYQSNKQVVFEEGYFLEGHKGIDDSSYDVRTTFLIEFPNYHRKSAFITLHSFLEVELNKLCGWFKSQNNLNLSVNDIKSDNGDIGRATKYLTKLVGLDWDKNGVWSEIVSLRTLRNKIVHEGGKINDSNEKLLNYVANSPYFAGDKLNKELIQEMTITSDQFLAYALSQYIKFCEEFDTAIKNSSI